MSRVYTVKSNARRDCRKLGLSPDLVIAKGDGWVISYPDEPKEKKAPAVKATKPEKAAKAPAAPKVANPKAPSDGLAKRDTALSMLADWTTLADLMAVTGWQAHTVRGFLSTQAAKQGLKIERQRVEGVTSYRVSA